MRDFAAHHDTLDWQLLNTKAGAPALEVLWRSTSSSEAGTVQRGSRRAIYDSLRTMMFDDSFRDRYRELQGRMEVLAAADGDVFLPSPEPDGPASYVLICMEPSLGPWARSPEQARQRVEAGFRNFLSSFEDFIVHFCVRRYLCPPPLRYHVTDLSKGAMLVDRAGLARAERYDRWYGLLQEEIDLVATADAGIIAVGRVVADHLVRRGFRRPITRVIHYSGQAGAARRAAISGREESFKAFSESVSLRDVVAEAERVLTSARVPVDVRAEALSRLARAELTTSRKELMFAYKVVFDALRAGTPALSA